MALDSGFMTTGAGMIQETVEMSIGSGRRIAAVHGTAHPARKMKWRGTDKVVFCPRHSGGCLYKRIQPVKVVGYLVSLTATKPDWPRFMSSRIVPPLSIWSICLPKSETLATGLRLISLIRSPC